LKPTAKYSYAVDCAFGYAAVTIISADHIWEEANMEYMPETFPGVGHRYLVDFVQFRVELDFTSETSLTYYNLDAAGKHVGEETVKIAVEPIRDGLFLVTWTEQDKTIVVHLEDYRLNRIITNITDPTDGLMRFEGKMTQLA
jgi:hypothetical protein